MKIIENHNYISWSTVSCDRVFSEKFIKSVSHQQAYSVCTSDNRKQYDLDILWNSMCSGNLDYTPKDAATIGKFRELGAKLLDIDFDKRGK